MDFGRIGLARTVPKLSRKVWMLSRSPERDGEDVCVVFVCVYVCYLRMHIRMRVLLGKVLMMSRPHEREAECCVLFTCYVCMCC
jgi:hypothetical protein